MGKRSWGLYAAVAGLVLVLAGCGGASTGSKGTGVAVAGEASSSPMGTPVATVPPEVVAPSVASPVTQTPSASPTVHSDGSGASHTASATPSPLPAAASPEAQSTAAPNSPTPSPAASDAGGLVTVEKITGAYKAQLTDLQSYYTKQLEQLYNQVIAAKKSGKSNEDILNTFSQQVLGLEDDSQAKVNALLMQMRTELTQHGLPLDSVNTLRAAYNAAIDQTKAAYAAKANTDLGIGG